MLNQMTQQITQISPDIFEGENLDSDPYQSIFLSISESLLEWGCYLAQCEETLDFLNNSKYSLLKLAEVFPTFSVCGQLAVMSNRIAIVERHFKIADKEVSHLNSLLLDLDALMEGI